MCPGVSCGSWPPPDTSGACEREMEKGAAVGLRGLLAVLQTAGRTHGLEPAGFLKFHLVSFSGCGPGFPGERSFVLKLGHNVRLVG